MKCDVGIFRGLAFSISITALPNIQIVTLFATKREKKTIKNLELPGNMLEANIVQSRVVNTVKT